MNLMEKASRTEMYAHDWGVCAWLVLQQNTPILDSDMRSDDASELVLTNAHFRKAIINEFSFKTISEHLATKALMQLASIAPTHAQFEYLVTKIADEAKHTSLFRRHLIEIGYASEEVIDQKLIDENKASLVQVMDPLKAYFEKYVVEQRDFICGVAIVTIVLEGLLAPSAELGEIKWKPFDLRASHVQRIGNQDEVRHLAVCASMVREAVLKDLSVKKRVLACVEEGMALWGSTPMSTLLLEREQWFQQGMEANLDKIKNYALAPGMLLSESTPETRLALAHEWYAEIYRTRMAYMQLQ